MANFLVLKGNLRLGLDTATPVLYDVSSEVTSFMIKWAVATIVVPATMSTEEGARPGQTTYTVDVNYLSNPGTNTLADLFYNSLQGTKTLVFSGNFGAGGNSTTNPNFTGTFVVSGFEIGGAIDTLSQGTGTFQLTGPPVRLLV